MLERISEVVVLKRVGVATICFLAS